MKKTRLDDHKRLQNKLRQEEIDDYKRIAPGDLVGISSLAWGLDRFTHNQQIFLWKSSDGLSADEFIAGRMQWAPELSSGMIVSVPRRDSPKLKLSDDQVLVYSFHDGSVGWCALSLLKRLGDR